MTDAPDRKSCPERQRRTARLEHLADRLDLGTLDGWRNSILTGVCRARRDGPTGSRLPRRLLLVLEERLGRRHVRLVALDGRVLEIGRDDRVLILAALELY